jgi:hypothetical protein
MTPLFTMPGWQVKKIQYANGSIKASVISGGSPVSMLMSWAADNGASVAILPEGIFVLTSFKVPKRPAPTKIYPIKAILATIIDQLQSVYPGNTMKLSAFKSKGVYTDVSIDVNMASASPAMMASVGAIFKDLPLVLNRIDVSVDNGNMTGKFTLEAVGN